MVSLTSISQLDGCKNSFLGPGSITAFTSFRVTAASDTRRLVHELAGATMLRSEWPDPSITSSFTLLSMKWDSEDGNLKRWTTLQNSSIVHRHKLGRISQGVITMIYLKKHTRVLPR